MISCQQSIHTPFKQTRGETAMAKKTKNFFPKLNFKLKMPKLGFGKFFKKIGVSQFFASLFSKKALAKLRF